MKCLWKTCTNILTTKSKFCNVKCKSKFHVDRRRRQLKKLAVDYKGSKCERCGYSKCIWALDFHHRDRSTKSFNISRKGFTHSWEKTKAELDKCDLLCANCHREIENELQGNKQDWFDSIDYKQYCERQNKKPHSCKCGKKIHPRCKTCRDCMISKNRPNKEWLEQLIWLLPFTEIGKIYNVTDNSVRKWCDKYNIVMPNK